MHRRYVMGTFLNVQTTGEASVWLTTLFYDEVQRLENLLSIYRPESEISRINRAAGLEPIIVSDETYQIIQEALRFAALSGGAFDPTVQPWGYRQLALSPVQRTVFLPVPGMRLDLGGIGKGFALDKALAKVREAGVPESVTADFGGQLLFWHRNGTFGPETIAIEDPWSGGPATTFLVDSNCSISTSSNAERPGHLLDPRTGRSVEGTGSVTVIAPTGTEAEALSTALFVLNAQERVALLEACPGVKALLTNPVAEGVS